MKKLKQKTPDKITASLNMIYDNADKSLREANITDKFSIELLKDTKKHLEILERSVYQTEIFENGTIKETILGYIEIKVDTVNEIIALELLLYDKKEKYQTLLIKSNREYAKLSKYTENIKLKNELKKELADEIYRFKTYLDELINVADRKRGILKDTLYKHQERNRILVRILEKQNDKRILSRIIPDKYALVQ
ncbi:hypothetical protein JXA34_02165 [Patescibacteria group bacterium]|nr:hypothetical protein [Patescibacteria group bacterium]